MSHGEFTKRLLKRCSFTIDPLSLLIVDIWRGYTNYELVIDEEETTGMTLDMIKTMEVDIICSITLSPSGKHINLFFNNIVFCVV